MGRRCAAQLGLMHACDAAMQHMHGLVKAASQSWCGSKTHCIHACTYVCRSNTQTHAEKSSKNISSWNSSRYNTDSTPHRFICTPPLRRHLQASQILHFESTPPRCTANWLKTGPEMHSPHAYGNHTRHMHDCLIQLVAALHWQPRPTPSRVP